MAQSNHKSLVRALLWWAALLSVSQAALLVLFFTVGRFGQSGDAQESRAHDADTRRRPWPSSERGIPHHKTKMFTYKTSGVHPNGTITWYAVESEDLPTDDGQFGRLDVKRDGSFFVCLRITLVSCGRSAGGCTGEVSVLKDDDAILTGAIQDQTLSTGLLCRAERMTAGNALRVKIRTDDPGRVKVKSAQSLSSLDIIYTPD